MGLRLKVDLALGILVMFSGKYGAGKKSLHRATHPFQTISELNFESEKHQSFTTLH